MAGQVFVTGHPANGVVTWRWITRYQNLGANLTRMIRQHAGASRAPAKRPLGAGEGLPVRSHRGTVANYDIVTSVGTRDGTGQNFGRLALSTGTGGSIDSSGFIFM